jgi:hypothetical protein
VALPWPPEPGQNAAQESSIYSSMNMDELQAEATGRREQAELDAVAEQEAALFAGVDDSDGDDDASVGGGDAPRGFSMTPMDAAYAAKLA